ncbi:hypothetical protein AB0395_21980 [Streptosporangium sp. NPDC051023]|uniref:hypothetical protein n=1 Tax=Streptosporangium sp. NPDC051023 TaxID=3155410 RepID=UPI00344B5F50
MNYHRDLVRANLAAIPCRSAEWTHPTLDVTGRADIALYPDGKSAFYQLTHPVSGPRLDVVIGATGAGTTNALRVITAESLAAGSAVVLFSRHADLTVNLSRGAGSALTHVLSTGQEIHAGAHALQAAIAERQAIRAEGATPAPLLHVVFTSETLHTQPGCEPLHKAIAYIAEQGPRLQIKMTLELKRLSGLGFTDGSGAALDALLSNDVLAYRTADFFTNEVLQNRFGPSARPGDIPPYIDYHGIHSSAGVGFVLGHDQTPRLSRTLLMSQETFARSAPLTATPLDARTTAAWQRGYEHGLNDEPYYR